MLILLWRLYYHGDNYLYDWERIVFYVAFIFKSPTIQLPSRNLNQDSLIPWQFPKKRRY